MAGLAWAVFRAGGLPRALLVVGCAALTSGLLFVAIAMLNLPRFPDEHLDPLVEETGLRGGTAFATVLLTVPALLLMCQAIRLGTEERERRIATLRATGAAPAQVRRLGALEAGILAMGGAALGIGVYAALRLILGGDPRLRIGYSTGLTELVPTTVAPQWWQVLLVIAGLGAGGCLLGWRVSRPVVVTPLGGAVGPTANPPRAWGLVPLLLSPLPVLWWIVNPTPVPPGAMGEWSPPMTSVLPGVLGVGLALLGAVTLTPWVAYRIGRIAERCAGSAATLLAARLLIVEPRAAGLASAAVGGIALVVGGAVGISMEGDDRFRPLVTASLPGTLVLALPVVAVHCAQQAVHRRRACRSLARSYVAADMDVLAKALRRQATLVALPMATVGVILGVLSTSAFILLDEPVRLLVVVLDAMVFLALVWLAQLAATQLVRVRAVDSQHLHTA